jgi:hypothetical protein
LLFPIPKTRSSKRKSLKAAWLATVSSNSPSLCPFKPRFADPPSDFTVNPRCRQNVLDAIRDTAMGVLKNDTTMIVSHLKIVPKGDSKA